MLANVSACLAVPRGLADAEPRARKDGGESGRRPLARPQGGRGSPWSVVCPSLPSFVVLSSGVVVRLCLGGPPAVGSPVCLLPPRAGPWSCGSLPCPGVGSFPPCPGCRGLLVRVPLPSPLCVRAASRPGGSPRVSPRFAAPSPPCVPRPLVRLGVRPRPPAASPAVAVRSLRRPCVRAALHRPGPVGRPGRPKRWPTTYHPQRA